MMRVVLVFLAWAFLAPASLAQNTQCPTPAVGGTNPIANGATCASQAFVTDHFPSSSTAGHIATYADGSGQLFADGGAIPSAPTGANPTATAGPAAINGTSPNFMRADAAPAVQKGSNSQFGLIECDGVGVGCTATPGVATILSATKAQQQAASLATVPVTPSIQQQHPSAAKAWVNFSGSGTNGAQTINASYNVTGVSRSAVGIYTITLTVSFASAAYVCTGSEVASATNGWVQFASLAAGSVIADFVTTGPTTYDPANGLVICFGAQ